MSQDVAAAAPASSDGDDTPQAIRRQFEDQLRQGARPRIEEFLKRAPVPRQDDLLRELVTLELQFLRRPGETFDYRRYYRRFPQSEALLDDLIGKWKGQSEAQADAEFLPPGPKQLETVVYSCVPTKFKQFELRSVIGEGSFGTVWRAWDTRLQREVAIKFPRADILADIDKSLFVREARVVARLRHPQIVAVYEVGENEENIYFVAELIDGQSLKTLLGTKQFTDAEAALLVAKIAAALEHAHRHGVVHRDLKPANILIDAQGDPHITDFGLAKRDLGEESLSIPGKIMGTPVYMSPEQARGDHQATDRGTDIYSLGVILYELLTGTPPFRGELTLLLQQVCTLPPVPPRTKRSSIPKDLEAICLKCLEKDPAKRYVTAQALADDLHFFLGGLTLRGIPPTIANRVTKWVYRNRRLMGIVAGVALCAGISVALILSAIAPPPPPAPFVQTVEFLTEPEGCEIIVYKVDPATGEPNPQTKRQASGKTPLEMRLEPGDYLVVAWLEEPRFKDERFHEVYRHVPDANDGVGFLGDQESWKKKPNGSIELPLITIPPLNCESGMGLADGADQMEIPKGGKDQPPEIWRIPPFYVDLEETSQVRMHSQAVQAAELAGKRLPTAGEIYYLCHLACPAHSEDETQDMPHDGACELPDHTVIRGLHADPWEWTSTRPAGPATAMPKVTGGNVARTFATIRVTGGGATQPNLNVLPHTGFLLQQEAFPEAPMGTRFVRSTRPRRSPEDFVTPALNPAPK